MDRPFHLDENTTVDIPMMEAKENFFYGENKDLGVQVYFLSLMRRLNNKALKQF